MNINNYRGINHGGSVVVLGNGPSLNQLPVPIRYDAIGINYSWRVVVSHYHCVGDDHHVKDLNDGKWTTNVLFNWAHLHVTHGYATHGTHGYVKEVRMDSKPQWWGSPRGPFFHSLSGSRAVQLARWLGYTTVYLVGFDGGGADFKGNLRRPNHYRNQVPELSQIIAGSKEVMEIYNCSSEDSPHDLPRFDIKGLAGVEGLDGAI